MKKTKNYSFTTTTCMIIIILGNVYLHGSSGFNVNETINNEINKNTDIKNIHNVSMASSVILINPKNTTHTSNWGENQSNIVDLLHPHDMKDKPTKFDLHISDITYMDINSSQKLNNTIDKNIINKTKTNYCNKERAIGCLEKNIGYLIDDISTSDFYNINEAVQIVRSADTTANYQPESIFDKIHRFAKNHVMKINFNKDLLTRSSRTFFGTLIDGKNPFLTGFGLGFLAFGLKKLLLPLFIGAQIIKSILIALFLPSILGSIGQIVGKGVSSFAQSSQGVTAQPEENFEFKDNADPYHDDYMTRQPLGTLPASDMYEENMIVQPAQKPNSRFSHIDSRLSSSAFNDRYYTRNVANPGLKKQDFKIFHEIPMSSLLLKNYDPFYSPLLSRLDEVFSRLGHMTEGCRKYAVCAMYRSPARYAPYSNLVSAQLSKELNELRRPSIDNEEILRYFRYMKAAKDGQDGVKCEEIYNECNISKDDPSLMQNHAMFATYQDINKLVHARKF